MLWQTIVFAVVLATPVIGICDSVTNIQLTPPYCSQLPFGEDVTINFDYSTDTAGGVRVFIRPLTDGETTPASGASGSSLYPAGDGSGYGTFSIYSGYVTVNQLEITVPNDVQS